MNIITEFDTSDASEIDHLLIAGKFEDANEKLKKTNHLQHSPSDTVAVIVKHLTDDNFLVNPNLYVASENLLKTFAHQVKEEEALFELLEIVETTKSDNVFTSTLKALQICIRRQEDRKVRSLEWCLNSILTYVTELPVPEHIKENSDADAERLYEDNDAIRRILTNYITLFLFYEPYLEDVLLQTPLAIAPFRNCETNRRNVLASFMLQLLNAPLYFLCLERPLDDLKSNINTYSWQCATTLVKHWTSLFPNPYFLFEYVERRIRFSKSIAKHQDGSVSADIFLIEEKSPLHSIGILFYLLYSENLMPNTAPKVYSVLYQFESILFLVTALLKTNIHSLHFKALRLCSSLLQLFGDHQRIPIVSLDLAIHEDFFTQLIRVITQTASKRNSQLGGQTLRRVIFQHSDQGRIVLVLHLLKNVQHNGVQAYVAAMYKDMISDALKNTDNKPLPEMFCGARLKAMLLAHICHLESGPETDLLKHSDTIITALNIVRFLCLSDTSNRTGFWDIAGLISSLFLVPLRRALELTVAHYRMEERRVCEGRDTDDVEVGVQLTTGEPMPAINRDSKLQLIRSAMNTFDLMDSLVGRVEECFRATPKT